jgi:hypothetical protein
LKWKWIDLAVKVEGMSEKLRIACNRDGCQGCIESTTEQMSRDEYSRLGELMSKARRELTDEEIGAAALLISHCSSGKEPSSGCTDRKAGKAPLGGRTRGLQECIRYFRKVANS